MCEEGRSTALVVALYNTCCCCVCVCVHTYTCNVKESTAMPKCASIQQCGRWVYKNHHHHPPHPQQLLCTRPKIKLGERNKSVLCVKFYAVPLHALACTCWQTAFGCFAIYINCMFTLAWDGTTDTLISHLYKQNTLQFKKKEQKRETWNAKKEGIKMFVHICNNSNL